MITLQNQPKVLSTMFLQRNGNVTATSGETYLQHLCNSCNVLATFMQPFKIIQSAFKENNLFITKQNIDIFDAPNIHIDLVPSYLLLSHMRGFWVLGAPGRMFQKFLTVKKLS